MKRSPAPQRKTPLETKTPLTRKTALGSNPLVRSALHAQSAANQRQPRTHRRNTGPTAKVRALVARRSQGWCEWSGCTAPATEVHHRLNRKQGGRGGEMAHRINQPAWLLHACRPHHDAVTSPSGAALVLARHFGWLLREGDDATAISVLTRQGRVWLADDGSTTPVHHAPEEAAA